MQVDTTAAIFLLAQFLAKRIMQPVSVVNECLLVHADVGCAQGNSQPWGPGACACSACTGRLGAPWKHVAPNAESLAMPSPLPLLQEVDISRTRMLLAGASIFSVAAIVIAALFMRPWRVPSLFRNAPRRHRCCSGTRASAWPPCIQCRGRAPTHVDGSGVCVQHNRVMLKQILEVRTSARTLERLLLRWLQVPAAPRGVPNSGLDRHLALHAELLQLAGGEQNCPRQGWDGAHSAVRH